VKNRRLSLPLAIALAAASPGAFALGLGQLQVKSGLSQPLVAEIPIISASPGELERLDVRLASPEAFARVGLDLPVELSQNLQFSLGRNAAGQPVIRITTPNRFTEPFLSFLIEADWGKGKVTREYTALIDPPYIAPAVIKPLLTPSIATAPAPPPPTVEEEVEAPPPAPAAPAQSVAIEEAPAASEPEPLPPPPVSEPAPLAVQPAAQPESLPPPPAPEPPAPVDVPEPQPVAAAPPEPAPEPVRAPEPEPEPARPAPEPEPVAVEAAPEPPPAAATPGQFGPVAPGETLFGIANTLRPDPAVTVNQMMLALLRANPEAFEGENINQLKQGSVLRVPRQDEVTSISEAEAAALVNQQTQAWRAPRAAVPQPEEASAAPAAPEPVAAAPKPAAPPAPPRVASSAPRPSSRLEIVPPSGNNRARGGQSGAAAGAGGVELRAELAQAREDLAARNSEITELKSRISDLEQQQNDRQRLVDLQNAQLKELQDRLRAVESGAPAAPAGPVSTVASAPITIDAGSDAATAAAVPAAPAASVPAPAPTPAAAAEPEAPTPWYLNMWTLVAAVVLILGGLVLLMRRSKPGAENGESNGRRLSDDEALKASIAKTRAAGARIATQPDAPVIVPAGKPGPTPEAAREGELALKALQDAVRERPNDLEAHLSLLRFHHSRGDAEAYQAAAQAMRAQLPTTLDPRWREAVVMGASLLPKTQMFSQAGWNTPRFDGDGAAQTPTATPTPSPATPPPAPTPAPTPTPAASRPAVAAAPTPAPAPPAPKPAPAPAAVAAAAAAPAAAAPAPVRVFDAPAEEVSDVADPNLFGEFGGSEAAGDASLMAEDEASATRIELAKAYLAIGDLDGARSMLEEVLAEGGAIARGEAARILKEIG
jgi:pilus assembly protein FimV